MAKQPFPEQFLMVERLQGEDMLRKSLTNYHTVSAWLEARQVGGIRNRRESATLGKIVDCLISTLGVMRAKHDLAGEVALRRLAAVTIAGKSGNWEAARELEEDHYDLVSETVRRKLHNSAKLCKELAGKTKFALRKQGDGDEQ